MTAAADFTSFPGKTVIGITGPVAGGKSLALSCFSKYGAEVISADEVNRGITDSPDFFVIISERYGNRFSENGHLDKKKFAEYIFSNENEKKWLEELLHPIILKKIHESVGLSEKEIIVVEMPLLFEAGLKNSFDLTLCISANEKKLYERAACRGWSHSHYRKRCAGQFSPEKKCSLADFVILNDSSAQEFEEKIRKFCDLLTKRTGSRA